MRERRAAVAGSHWPISNALPAGWALGWAPSDVQVLCGGGKCHSLTVITLTLSSLTP